MTDTPPSTASFPRSTGTLSLWAILKQTLHYYRRHGLAFTRVLLLPVAQLTLSAYGCVALVNWLAAYLITQQPDFVEHNKPLVLACIGLICLAALLGVIRGGWQYVVYWASLNRNALEAIEQQLIDFKAAYRRIAQTEKRPYQTLLLIYCALPLSACLPLLLAPVLGGLLVNGNPLAGPLLLLAAFLFSCLLFVVWLIAAVFLSFVFQIAAFEPLPANPAIPCLKSAQLVRQRLGATLGLQAILLIATNYLLNLPLALLLRALRLSLPLDALHRWIIDSSLEGAHLSADTGLQAQALSMVESHLPELAATVTDSILMLLITALLLPLGTFAFTLLYRDILQSQPKPHESA